MRWFHGPDEQPRRRLSQGWLDKVQAADALPRVEIVTSHADTDGGLVHSLLAAAENHPRRLPRGIVVAATGNGTLHRALESALVQAQAMGVRVIRSTRCARGRVIPDAGNAFPDSQGLSPVKARLALALNLLFEEQGH